ncbi:MAG TPA: four helix bundle protein [Longimicrobiales bacterium]
MNSPDHERLQVYRMSIDAVAAVHTAMAGIPAGPASLLDQLRRAAISIPLNIAEGAGEHRWREKARFYRIARRSAAESAAALDVMLALELGDAEGLRGIKRSFTGIIAMLVRLGAAMEAQATGRGKRLRTCTRRRTE